MASSYCEELAEKNSYSFAKKTHKIAELASAIGRLQLLAIADSRGRHHSIKGLFGNQRFFGLQILPTDSRKQILRPIIGTTRCNGCRIEERH
jgi:hypothetical protein